jgi:uncharacterized phage-associated protein
MRQIRFEFDPEKSVQALAYLASRGVKGLDVLKSAKLLYFADKMHLLKYGRPITGDQYFCMKHGPIPNVTLTLIQDALSTAPTGDSEQIQEYFAVNRSPKYPQLVLKGRKQPDLDVFSESDIEVLDEVVKRYGKFTGWKLRKLAHEEPDVKIADRRRMESGKGSILMPVQLLFAGAPDQSILQIVEQDQDARDFAESLTW